MKIGNEKNNLDMFDSTVSFFDYRARGAFSGLRGLKVIDEPAECVRRLSVLLQQPLKNSEKLRDPIWWFRGCSCLPVDAFEIISDTKCRVNIKELEIKKIACYISAHYVCDFVYVEAKAENPVGINPHIDEEYINRMAARECYACEEFGLYHGRPITRAEYDDGAAVIDGSIVRFKGEAELRERYLTPYNFVICAKYHPFNSPEGDKFTGIGLNDILNGTLSIEQFAEMSESLPCKKENG